MSLHSWLARWIRQRSWPRVPAEFRNEGVGHALSGDNTITRSNFKSVNLCRTLTRLQFRSNCGVFASQRVTHTYTSELGRMLGRRLGPAFAARLCLKFNNDKHSIEL